MSGRDSDAVIAELIGADGRPSETERRTAAAFEAAETRRWPAP
jgi:hypothetical protein